MKNLDELWVIIQNNTIVSGVYDNFDEAELSRKSLEVESFWGDEEYRVLSLVDAIDRLVMKNISETWLKAQSFYENL